MDVLELLVVLVDAAAAESVSDDPEPSVPIPANTS